MLHRVRRSFTAALLAAVALVIASAATAFAATTVTQFASGQTAPNSGLILNGTTINPATGFPFRHLWYGDGANGLCRLDPDVDTVSATRTINISTCIHFVFGAQFKPGQLAFDPSTNNIYAVDIQANTQGIFRLHFLPGGDGGHGALDLVHQEVLGGLNNGCGVPGNRPDTAVLGPDGNLYVGFKQSGNLVRINAPQTEPLPCSNVVVMGQTGDNKKDFGLGWIGHDLYGGDGFSPWVIPNADQCFTPSNQFQTCKGGSILAGTIPVPMAIASDQVYPATNGTTLYYANPNTVTRFQVLPTQQVTTNYAGGFQFVSGLTLDTLNTASPILYVGDDPSNGLNAGQGHWWSVTGTPPPPAAPAAPTGVTATAGDGQATVSWTAGAQGSQPITSYTVHTLTPAGGPTGVADVVVTATPPATSPPITAAVAGLTNGTSYEFTVQAANSVGTSPASAPSNVVTPQAATAPGAPTGVSALAGNASASVAWTPPASNGGAPITSYTVTALVNGSPSGVTATAGGSATGAIISGLTNGTTYTFTVAATNRVGTGPASAPSSAVTPSANAAPPDTSVSMTGPASVPTGANVTYNLTVSNLGPSPAPQVILTDNLPVSGVTFLSDTTSQGICSTVGSTITCNLGAMAANASAGLSVSVNVTAAAGSTITNAASVQANDSSGSPLSDPNPANNSTSVSTSVTSNLPPATTDLQVTGSSNNGGPTSGQAFSYTWQVKNNQDQTANGVQFTDNLPSQITFQQVSASTGTCSGPPAGASGGTVSCSMDGLAKGQTQVITVNVQAGSTLGTVSTTGSVTFNGTDTNPSNNQFTVTVQIK
jgi:uncharacterized repeat protein (TIGR01451 family)